MGAAKIAPLSNRVGRVAAWQPQNARSAERKRGDRGRSAERKPEPHGLIAGMSRPTSASRPAPVPIVLHDALCFAATGWLLRAASAIESWRRGARRVGLMLVGSLRKLLRAYQHARGVQALAVVRRRAANRTPGDQEDGIVWLHVTHRRLGTGQLRDLAFRLFGFTGSRETVRKILLRNQAHIARLERAGREPPRRITTDHPNELWGVDLTLVWILGFFPSWVLGIVDYHGSYAVALERLRDPTAEHVAQALSRAFARHGAPVRILSDRGTVFRSERVRRLLASARTTHTVTRPCHPWTNGRIERLFRTYKGLLRDLFWLVPSRRALDRMNRDFVTFYNQDRPHQAHGGRTPHEVRRNLPRKPTHSGPVSYFGGKLHWWRLG